MNVVYPVRRGDSWGLRYSLRTLANLVEAVDELIIVGDLPTWLHGAYFIPGNRFQGSKPRNVYDNMRLVCQDPVVPEDLVILNDDFFLLRPTKPLLEYRCGLQEHLAALHAQHRADAWTLSLEATLAHLRSVGVRDPLSYELHRPLPVRKDIMREALTRALGVTPHCPPQWRTLYGNHLQEAGVQAIDCKIYDTTVEWHDWDMVSTHDSATTRAVIDHIAKIFPDPSPWEKVG